MTAIEDPSRAHREAMRRLDESSRRTAAASASAGEHVRASRAAPPPGSSSRSASLVCAGAIALMFLTPVILFGAFALFVARIHVGRRPRPAATGKPNPPDALD